MLKKSLTLIRFNRWKKVPQTPAATDLNVYAKFSFLLLFHNFSYTFILQNVLSIFSMSYHVNPLMGKLKPQSNGQLYSNTVIGSLAVDG